MTKRLARVACLVIGLQFAVTAQQWWGWVQAASTGPGIRYEHAMAYDSQRGKTVMFGGYSIPLGLPDDTWEWDGLTWIQVAVGGPARRQHALAYDSQRGRTVMFGGMGVGSETWEWDGLTWSQAGTTGPTARWQHAMAYDGHRGKTVLFGGMGGLGFGQESGETWEWDGTVWTRIMVTPPTWRYAHAMVFDSQRHKVVLFGGHAWANGPLGTPGDTWEWDGASWVQVATSGPAGRDHPSMTFDAHRNRVVLAGSNETWWWDGSAWTQVGFSSPSTLGPVVYDAQRSKVVMYAGAVGETWELDFYGVGGSANYGAGCGNPTLNLSTVAGARPIIGTTAQVEVGNAPLPLAWVAWGWSQSLVGPFALPLHLIGYGMPGCNLLQSFDNNCATLPSGPGIASYSLPLPNWPGLLGLRIYLQGWAPAPGQNAAGIIVSNGVEWVIGNT